MPDMDGIVARHKARYHLGAFLARSGMKVLDFPCGSGYGADIIKDVNYIGMDVDEPTITYANYHHNGVFFVNDMTCPKEIGFDYDLILCVEGLEHIEKKFQEPLIEQFYYALKPGGRLLVSMPEGSGPNPDNPYHLWELTFNDFMTLLRNVFINVQIVCHDDMLHNGKKANLMFGICRKGEHE